MLLNINPDLPQRNAQMLFSKIMLTDTLKHHFPTTRRRSKKERVAYICITSASSSLISTFQRHRGYRHDVYILLLEKHDVDIFLLEKQVFQSLYTMSEPR